MGWVPIVSSVKAFPAELAGAVCESSAKRKIGFKVKALIKKKLLEKNRKEMEDAQKSGDVVSPVHVVVDSPFVKSLPVTVRSVSSLKTSVNGKKKVPFPGKYKRHVSVQVVGSPLKDIPLKAAVVLPKVSAVFKVPAVHIGKKQPMKKTGVQKVFSSRMVPPRGLPKIPVVYAEVKVPMSDLWNYRDGEDLTVNDTKFTVDDKGSCLLDKEGYVMEINKCFL